MSSNRVRFVCFAVIFTLAAGSASAQNAVNWTGYYVGVNAGGAWTDSDIGFSLDPGTNPIYQGSYLTAIADSGPASVGDEGFTGGGQVGFSIQSSNLVYGLEGDFNSLNTDVTRQVTVVVPAFPAFPFSHTESVSTDWLATVRARVGFVNGPALFYVTGGLALTNFKHTYNFSEPGNSVNYNASTSETKAGWTVGGGAELVLDRNWSIKGEYLFADFGELNTSGIPVLPGDPTRNSVFNTSADLTVQTARAGLNYRF